MAEEHHNKSHEHESKVGDEGAVETQDRGLFDFLGKKKEEKPQEEVIVTEFEKIQVSEAEPHVVQEEHKEEEKQHGLLEKLRRSGSSSSSSSDEEEGEGEDKKKKKKKKEKISGEKEHEDTTVPVEKYEEAHVVTEAEAGHPEEKKGFLDKIKDKLPGQHKKTDEVTSHPPPPPPPTSTDYPGTEAASQEGETKEKKGFLDKIKEKLPGYHPKTEEDKEKEKESATH